MNEKEGRRNIVICVRLIFISNLCSVFLILRLFPFGFVQYAHRKCVQHWCDEKGDIICEICHQVWWWVCLF